MHVSKKLQVVVNETSEEEKVDEKSLVTSAPTYLCYNEIQEMTMKPAKTKKTQGGENEGAAAIGVQAEKMAL